MTIDRREVIRRISALLGGAAFVGGRDLLAAAERTSLSLDEAAQGEFSAADIALLDEIAETILPATNTPGARAAKTGAFMALMVTDSYSPAERKIFREGMRKVDRAARRTVRASFMDATPPQRTTVLSALDREQKLLMDAQGTVDQPVHYFRMMKELALLGYFTSEIGCTQAMRFVETPGRFEPCISYTPGEPAWAAHA